MNPLTQTWSSNGKLLITGEYLVMEGALSFALPLQKRQTLNITPNNSETLKWQANKPEGVWFYADYNLSTFSIIKTDNLRLAQKLQDVLISVRRLSASFLAKNIGYNIDTNLDFNPEYGFGTSSTLISNIAMWADVDPYQLLNITFGGSGYDIACARSSKPLLFQKNNDDVQVKTVNFNPSFADMLYFVYLGNKQNSSDSIEAFKKKGNFNSDDISFISNISTKLVESKHIEVFEELLDEHELVISRILGLPTVKSLYFSDFNGSVKSLGAWGGDFVMVVSSEPEDKLKNYLLKKGFGIVFNYDSLVLGN